MRRFSLGAVFIWRSVRIDDSGIRRTLPTFWNYRQAAIYLKT